MDRVNWVTKDCFNAIMQLTRLAPNDAVQPELIHGRMRGYVQSLLQRAREAGYPEQDGRLMAYAIVALCDELVMTKAGALRELWSANPLQLTFFKENTAGENFFTRLDELRADAQRQDVLRVFYLVLLFGFRGQYGARGREDALQELTDGVREQLLRALAMPEVLAPNGLRPEEGLLDAGRRLPLVWMALGVLALSSVLYMGMAASLREHLQSFGAWMQQAGGA